MSGGNAQREIELKLDLPADSVKRVLRHRSVERHGEGAASVRRLRSTYFDTVDRALLQAGLSLRIREIGDGDPQRIQTLKAGERARSGLFQRWEDEVEIDAQVPEPQAVADLTLRGTLQRTLAGRTLRPLFVTDMLRSQRAMCDGEDAWSLDLDVGEVRAGDLCEPLCELELELIRGSAVRLYDAALELLDDIPLTVGFVSKSERGYALVEGKRARQPLAKALGRMREALEGAPEAQREALEPELRILEEECAKARRDDDFERLHHSPRFARAALVLGRLAAGE